MNKELIRDLAITGGIYDCITDPYDKLKNGDPYSSVMVDLERFAEKIVRECIRIGQETSKDIFKMSKKEGDIFEYESHGAEQVVDNIKEHFGVEE